MSFETRNIEVVLYNLLKNVQCTLVMKPSYTWQIEYFKHQQIDQWETSTSPCENIKSMYYFNSLLYLLKNDVLTISGYKIFFSTNIYSNKLCNISFERAQNMLYRKK